MSNELEKATNYHNFKREVEWNKLSVEFQKLLNWPEIRKGYGDKACKESVVIVNGELHDAIIFGSRMFSIPYQKVRFKDKIAVCLKVLRS